MRIDFQAHACHHSKYSYNNGTMAESDVKEPLVMFLPLNSQVTSGAAGVSPPATQTRRTVALTVAFPSDEDSTMLAAKSVNQSFYS